VDESAVTERVLPGWPLFVLFGLFPIWWLLGLAAFAVALAAIPMLILLIQLRKVEVPPAFWLWIGFVVWALVAGVELNAASRAIGFGVRMGNYMGSGVLFLYIYNARQLLPTRRVLRALAMFFTFVVIGGYLGVLIPHGSVPTPAEALLPGSIRANEYVHALVHPSFAEVQQPYGSPSTFYRPSAPFAYTNGWGCNVALLFPLMVAAIMRANRWRYRFMIVGLLAAACVPAFATLNRGMFLALGFVLVYASLRLAFRGRLAPMWIVSIGAAAVAGVALSLGVVEKLQERLHYSQTNVSRQTIYQEAFDGAVKSPIFGHGAPQPSVNVDVSVGTQGQIWNVMFSYGFIALAFFMSWFALVVLLSWTARDQADLWIHATGVVVFITLLYYGYDGTQLAVAMAAAALALRTRATSMTDSPPRPRLASPRDKVPQ
jgi:hypothetical protein